MSFELVVNDSYEEYKTKSIFNEIRNYVNSLGYNYSQEYFDNEDNFYTYDIDPPEPCEIERILIKRDLDELDGHTSLIIGLFLADLNYGPDIVLKYYQNAADKGTIYGLIRLGMYYEYCNDEDKLLYYYNLATEKGHSGGLYRIGKYYHLIWNFDNMLKYYELAIEKNNKYAMYDLGIHYVRRMNFDKAEHYILMAIDKGHSEALQKLIKHYLRITNNYDKSIQLAIAYINVDIEYCKEFINENIFKCKEFKSYLNSYPYLNDNNINDVNKFLSDIIIASKNNNNDIFITFECVNCLILKECVYYPCGHPCCYNCCSHDIKCRICSSISKN